MNKLPVGNTATGGGIYGKRNFQTSDRGTITGSEAV